MEAAIATTIGVAVLVPVRFAAEMGAWQQYWWLAGG